MNINLYLSELQQDEKRLAEELRKEAQRQDRSLSFIVREALEQYLNHRDNESEK